MVVPINDPVIKWATYKVGLYPLFPSQAFARNAVRIERKIELAMEGQRFFDLRRWGIADTTITSFLATESNRRSFLRSEEHTSELQSRRDLVCRLLLEKKKKNDRITQPKTKRTKHTNLTP